MSDILAEVGKPIIRAHIMPSMCCQFWIIAKDLKHGFWGTDLCNKSYNKES